ncbi:MAG TPA: trypsin [Methylococcales bacterium]|jgi:VanZ family protein|nr:trypsin [Methylococcales bacterium]
MYKFVIAIAVMFFGFITWIIYLANTGGHSVFFDFTRAIPYGDKLGHFCLFGILTLLGNLALKMRLVTIARFKIYLGSLLVLLFVTVEELSQEFIATRTLDYGDLVADFLGVAVFSFLASWVSSVYFSEKKRRA